MPNPSRPPDEDHRAEERAFWRKQLRIAEDMNRITLCAAVAAIAGLFFVWTGLEETHKATIEANRAWLAPTLMAVSVPTDQGSNGIYTQLLVVNSGRGPAIGVMGKFTPYLVSYIPETNNPNAILVENNACFGLRPKANTGAIYYPFDGKTQTWIPYPIPRSQVDPQMVADVIARRKSLVVDGCLAYLTFGEAHWSKFRFFLRDSPSQPSAPWAFNHAETGNGAD